MRLYKPIVITIHYSALAVYRNEPWGIFQLDYSLLYRFECLEHLSRSYLSMLQESNPWRWGEKSFLLDVIQPESQNEGDSIMWETFTQTVILHFQEEKI